SNGYRKDSAIARRQRSCCPSRCSRHGRPVWPGRHEGRLNGRVLSWIHLQKKCCEASQSGAKMPSICMSSLKRAGTIPKSALPFLTLSSDWFEKACYKKKETI